MRVMVGGGGWRRESKESMIHSLAFVSADNRL